MATFDLQGLNEEEGVSETKGTAVPLNFEPYNGDVIIYVNPKTRSLLTEAATKSKSNKNYRRHTVKDPNVKGGRRVVDGDENAAFTEELADLIIADWDGVEEGGIPVECNRENKVKLFNNLRVSNYLLEVAEDLADALSKGVEKNSVTS